MDDEELRAARTKTSYRRQSLHCCWTCRHSLVGSDVSCDLRQAVHNPWPDELVSAVGICDEWEEVAP